MFDALLQRVAYLLMFRLTYKLFYPHPVTTRCFVLLCYHGG